VNKAEAAEFLGVSVRAVERYTSAGKLPSRYVRGKTGQILYFSEADLQVFKDELEMPVEKAATSSVDIRQQSPANERRQGLSTALATVDALNSTVVAHLMQAAFDKGRQALPVPVADKLLLTVDEAAAYAGVGRRAIETAIKSGTLVAHRGLAQGRRVRRADLEAWISKL